MRTITFILFLLLANVGKGQSIPTFSKFYTVDSFFSANSTVILDGDSLVLMPSYFDANSFQALSFIKTDINGNEAYRSLIRKPDTILGAHFGLEAHKTHSGYYIFGGQIFKRTDNVANIYLYKLNQYLDTIYLKKINDGDCSYFGSVIELSDNNYLISGYKRPCQNGVTLQTDGMIIKTDTNGTILWRQQETHSHYSGQLYSAAILGGFYTELEILNSDEQTDSLIEIRKYNNAGVLKWILPLGVAGQMNKHGVMISTHDGGGICTLSIIDTGSGSTNIYAPSVIYRFDSSGNILWEKWFNATNVLSISELTSGSIIFAESSYGLFSDTVYTNRFMGHLFCLSGSGNLLWEKLYTQGVNTNYDSYFFDVTQSSDGGIVATGQAVRASSQKTTAWLVKVDSNGCLNGDCPQLYSGVSEINDQKRFIVFPNPSTTQYTIALKETQFMHDYKMLTFTLYDVTGRIVSQQVLDKQATTFQRMSISDGLYLWQISDGSRVVSKGKLIFK